MAKPKTPQREGRRITIRVSDAVYDAIAVAAEERQWSIAHYVGQAVEKAVGVTTLGVARRAPPTRK